MAKRRWASAVTNEKNALRFVMYRLQMSWRRRHCGALSARRRRRPRGCALRARSRRRAASAAQEALQERLEQLQSDFASLDAAKGQSPP